MTAKLAKKLAATDPVVGSWVSVGHPSVAEVTAQVDFDTVVIDLEHTPTSLETVQSMVHAVEAADGDTEPLIRVPSNDRVFIKRVLDTGPAGIIVPMVDSPEEAREIVESTQYPPEGARGIAGSRATGYGQNLEEYVTSANDSILTLVQIETEKAVDRAEDIAAVDGIDALFVGPADLSGAMDMFGRWGSEAFAEALETVVESAHDVGTPVGTLALREADIQARVDQGFDFLVVGKDTKYIADESRRFKQLYENYAP